MNMKSWSVSRSESRSEFQFFFSYYGRGGKVWSANGYTTTLSNITSCKIMIITDDNNGEGKRRRRRGEVLMAWLMLCIYDN